MDTTQNYTNPNANYFTSGKTFDTSKPIPVSGLTSSQTPVELPPQNSLTQNPDYYAGVTAGIPTVQDLTAQAQSTSPSETTNQTLMQKILGSVQKLGGKQQAQAQAETTAGIPQFQTQLTDINAQLQGLQKEALAIPLQLQQDVQGRGVTAGGLAPIQTGQLRQNAIRSLGLSSIAQTLQGNIANAQAQADRAVQMEFAPVEAELKYLQTAYEMNKDILNREDKKKADALNIQLRLIDEAKQEKKSISDIAIKLSEYGQTDMAQKVLSARNFNEAISMASGGLVDPKAKAELESIKLNQILTRAQINKENYQLQLLQKYNGLTPEQYANQLKVEQKAINDAKTGQEKSRLQAQALDSKITLLGSVLDSSAIDSVVGPNALSRAATSVKGELGRVALGAGAGAAAGSIFGGVGAIPGAIIGGVLAGGQGAKDYFTGAPEKLIGQTEQFISKEFLQNLIDVKAQGATFGALQKAEQDALTAAATYIGQRRIYSGTGEDKQVVGYDMSEADFRRELQTIQDLTRKAYERATGKSFDATEQSTLDQLFNQNTPTPANYY